jgi:hypothetical protein
VTELVLNSNNLAGPLPSELQQLSALQVLFLGTANNKQQTNRAYPCGIGAGSAVVIGRPDLPFLGSVGVKHTDSLRSARACTPYGRKSTGVSG